MVTTRRRVFSWKLLSLGLVSFLVILFILSDLHKLEYSKLFSRASWQHTERVIESLGIQSGDQVADIGAGDGYFTLRFADAVGPEGKVYAVEVAPARLAALELKAEELGHSNVIGILAEIDDPLLPDREIDLVFLCNSYHHIENRPSYFDRLRSDLSPEGRVVIVDLKPNLLVRAFVPSDHWIKVEPTLEEMSAANYHLSQTYEFLPVQHFLVFVPNGL
jgi:ubiquinone/menaquinone biosynthesis C-methylase UbiE